MKSRISVKILSVIGSTDMLSTMYIFWMAQLVVHKHAHIQEKNKDDVIYSLYSISIIVFCRCIKMYRK